MVKLGMHVSITGTIDQAADRAQQVGCDTFQIFTRNPRGWGFKKLKRDQVEEFKRKKETHSLNPVVAHMPYLPNLSSPNKALYNKSLRSLKVELDRCAMLEIPYIVTHLGSHLGKGSEIGLERIALAINEALSRNESDVMLLLENMAGTKNSMGSSFEEIKRILDRAEMKDRVGVCFDTAHAFAAGYDLRNQKGVQETLSKFDATIGLRLMKVIHLNDSKGPLGCSRDRHEHIGMGYIGEEGFKAFLKREPVRNLPFIMETPIDKRRDDVGNMRKVRQLSGDRLRQ